MKRKVISMFVAMMMVASAGVFAFAAVPSAPTGNGMPTGMQPGGNNASSVSWSGATTVTSADTLSSGTYTSSSADENALLINTSESVTVNNPTVTKTGGTSASDQYSFYGINSGIMVKGGATVTINGGTVNTAAAGANGVFCYGANNGSTNAVGDGTTVNISDTEITTTGNGSGGIMNTYGGTINASDLTINTSGNSSAPIRTDRGGGWVNVTGGEYTSNGLGSPVIYSTADVNVSDATLTSNLSEGVCIEGTGSVELTDCDLTASNTGLNGNANFYDSIMIYQSMSGDADNGSSAFTMTGGTLTSNNGHVFHVTNTTAIISLSDVDIDNNDSDNVLISVCDDGWNGGNNTAVLNAEDQTLSGTVLVGDNSTLFINLSGDSVFTGNISGDIVNAKGTTVSSEVGDVYVTLADDAEWVLTADTYITGFSGDADNVNTNGYTLYVNGSVFDGTNTEIPTLESVIGTNSGSGTMPQGQPPEGQMPEGQPPFVTGSAMGGPEGNAPGGNMFNDVKENNWYFQYVTSLAQSGVINGMGDGSFAPSNTLTWAQAMKLLLCAHGDLESVTGSQWATTSMNKASELGLCASSQSANGDISRLEFCRAAAKAFGIEGDGTTFSDCNDPAVCALAGAGVINGYTDGTFGPDKTITRAEISKVIYLLQQLEAATEE